MENDAKSTNTDLNISVILQSLLDNSNPHRIYRFILLERRFFGKTKELLNDQIS